MSGSGAILTRRRVIRAVVLVIVLVSIRAYFLYPPSVIQPSHSSAATQADSLLENQADTAFFPDPDFDDLATTPKETDIPVEADVKHAAAAYVADGADPSSNEGVMEMNNDSLDSKILVVASMRADNTSWYHEFFPDWQKAIYVMDDPEANFTVARNKGRESTAYLTYIIDHYDDLPENMFFLHSQRYQWHNEDPMYDGVTPIRNLQLPYVQRHGYANMRCTWTLGCPAELHPNPQKTEQDAPAGPSQFRDNTEAAFTQAYLDLFPEAKPGATPLAVGIPCGAQFALSRQMVHKRPLSDYKRYRNWLWETELPDAVSGRILEYSWHIIMGKPFEYCPDAKECFCEKFGICGLNCTNHGTCDKRYQLPKLATIPQGWPERGSGEDGFPAMGWWE